MYTYICIYLHMHGFMPVIMYEYIYLGIFHTYYFFWVQMTPPSAYMNVGMCIQINTYIHTFVCLYILWYGQFSTIIWTFHYKSLSRQLHFSEFCYSLTHTLPVVKLCLHDKQDTFRKLHLTFLTIRVIHISLN